MADQKPRPIRLRPKQEAPEKIKINLLQAERLAALSNLEAREVHGQTVAELADKLRFRIDPELLFLRKICGRVVKKDPSTGIEYPVPYATVIVEDTDCSLLGYFPRGSRWSWYFPFRCRREVLATVKTDKCGEFCVYVPRWDVDWILRWRRERICFPIIFERPTLADLLEDLVPREPFPPKPGPDPDPSWLLNLDRGQLLSTVEQRAGRTASRQLGTVLSRLSFGAPTAPALEVLQSDAFDESFPPPISDDLRLLRVGERKRAGARPAGESAVDDGVRTTLAARLKLDVAELGDLDLRRFIGPFRRCYDRVFPEWTPILDVPDITFRVTQDVNGDGTEETIYSEGYFQVRWNAGPLPNVKLVASAAASGDPADLLPRDEPAESPFHAVVPIFGCLPTGTAATHYRILNSYRPDDVTVTPFLPILNQTWPVTRLDATNTTAEYHTVAPDAGGWYPLVIPKGGNPNDWEPQNLLLDWNTYAVGNGKHVLRIELGSGGVPLSPQPSTDDVAFHVDNAYPITGLTVQYRKNGVGPFLPLTFPCPVVRRGAAPQLVEFEVSFTAAARHLRSSSLGGSGCGGGNIIYKSGKPADWHQNAAMDPTTIAHWHVDVDDNSVSVTARFELAASALQGTYSFGGVAASRALNPAGGDGGHLVGYEYDPSDIYVTPGFAFSVIDAD